MRRAPSLRDAVLKVIDGAIETLRSARDDESVHAARKACKLVRAGLRLLRGSLGVRAYRRENRRIRDAARPLTAVRDAFVLQRALRTVAAPPVLLERRLLARYRRERRKFDRGGTGIAVRQLRATRKRLRERPRHAAEGASAIDGVRRIYAAGRRSLAKARSGDDARLHEWRKQTQHLMNALDLIEAVYGARFPQLRRRAHRLAETLGEDHDLGVLLSAAGPHLPAPRRLAGEIGARRRKLQARAFQLGERLYRHTPEQFESAVALRLTPRRRVSVR